MYHIVCHWIYAEKIEANAERPTPNIQCRKNLGFAGLETIPDSGFGWVGFDFLAEMGDLNAKVLAVLLGFRTPDFAQDVAMGEGEIPV
jgi:hypothetical protein